MALQIRRLISSTFWFRRGFRNPMIPPAMLHYRAVPSFAHTCLSGLPCSRRFGSELQVRTSNCLQRHRDMYTTSFGVISSLVARGSGHMLEVISYEMPSRLYSSKSPTKHQTVLEVNEVGNGVVDIGNKNDDLSSSSLVLHGKKKKKQPSSFVSSINGELDKDVGNLSTKQSRQQVKPIAGTIGAKKSVQNLLKDGNNKKGSTKTFAKVNGCKSFKKKDQNFISKSHEGNSEPCTLYAVADSEVLRKASKAKKIGAVSALQVAQDKKTIPSTGGAKLGNQLPRPLYPPSGKSVVVVESITKARVIQNYLGDMYDVLASYGHVRDLARRSRSVRPDEEFSMVWEVPPSAWTHLKCIKVALSCAENLILASDPDREGEAIAWHITEMLQQQDALNENIKVARVVFHEITESSVKAALQAPREIDQNLVNAYLARRALDYLIGFSISPLLWRKLPGCQSAGRVQSAALALICDRETEIEQFNSKEYWTVGVEFSTCSNALEGTVLSSSLTHLNSKRLEQFSILQKEAEVIEKMVNSSKFEVINVKRSNVQRNPPMPYITSTLQQDSANKLQFTAAYTMKLAQQLYEGVKLSDNEATGLITYMRTDGVHVSKEAADDINTFVRERYGREFASNGIRKYFKKVKNAQEAHEAIRPTNIRRLPCTLSGILDDDSLKMYALIWSRTMACQMEPVSLDMIQVDIGNTDGDMVFRAVGSRIGFPGYETVYKDREAGVDLTYFKELDSNEDAFLVLNNLKVKDSLSLVKVNLGQHYTKPPHRYSEGTLVKKLEELGIGRPSTYASIMKVLQDRNYVTMKNRALHPQFRGRMVSEFLSHHFSEVADYSFTAGMESELDNVSAGTTEWKGLMKDYWSRFSEYCNIASKADIHQVEKMLEEKFSHTLFSSLPNRTCPSCGGGTLRFKVSRFGSGYFVGCDQHPKCKFIAGTVLNDEEDIINPDKPETKFPPRLLGYCPNSNEKVYLKNGPYGYYVQLGDDKTSACPPKRSSITEGTGIDSVTLEDAMELLQYPKNLSTNPKTLSLETGLKFLKSKNAKQCGRPKRKPRSEELEEEEEDALVG
ncbi:hypothetical protein HPP92_015046 [Vanilla planifolia]|uniref:DNA topoisomerase n=1 Tax=Vanilla planifolia TaxID=51239 RepID=A0A835UWU5_VANPL|nr:hypothetical protein HPP92_015046 [Vanilla planifolia]